MDRFSKKEKNYKLLNYRKKNPNKRIQFFQINGNHVISSIVKPNERKKVRKRYGF